MNLATLVSEGDFNRPSEAIALDLIYVANGFKFPLAQAKFGIPRMLDQRPDILTDENTFVPADVAAEVDDRFPGETGFLYTRLDLSVLPDAAGVELTPVQYPFRVSEVLFQINAAWGTQLTERDILDELIVSPVLEWTIKAAPTSLVWLGERVFSIGNALSYPLGSRITVDGRFRVTATGAYRVVVTANE